MMSTAVERDHRCGDRSRRCAADRPRPLQGDQRHPRPCRRRRTAGRGRRPGSPRACVTTTWWRGSAAMSSPCSPVPSTDARTPNGLAERISEGLRQTFQAGGVRIDVHCSVGIALFARARRRRSKGCCDAPTSRSTPPRSRAARMPSTTRAVTPTRSRASGCSPSFASALEDADDDQVTVSYQPQLDLKPARVPRGGVPGALAPPRAGRPAARRLHPTRREHHPHRAGHPPRPGSGAGPARALGEPAASCSDAAVNLSARHLGDLSLPETMAPAARAPRDRDRSGSSSKSPRAG